MMGTQIDAAQSFYEFRLDDHVPADHLLRRIDRFLDLTTMRSELKPFYSSIGPALDRSGADDADIDRGLLHGHPVRAAAV